MLERAVAAVRENKAKTLDMFNKGDGGFRDRNLYGCQCSARVTLAAKRDNRVIGRHSDAVTQVREVARPLSLLLQH